TWRRAERSSWSWPAARRRRVPKRKRRRRANWRAVCSRKVCAPARSPASSRTGSVWHATGRTRSRSLWQGSGEEGTLDRADSEPGPAARGTGRRGESGSRAERTGPAASRTRGAPPHHRAAPVLRRRGLVREPILAAQPADRDPEADRPAGLGAAGAREADGRRALDVSV